MEGQSEGSQRKKSGKKTACDVGCQTDQSTSSSSSSSSSSNGYQNNPQSSTCASSNARNSCPTHASAEQWEKTTKEGVLSSGSTSSASASGASTPGQQPASSSPAPSVNSSTQASSGSEKKLPGPAGVKPTDVEAYFGDKKPSGAPLLTLPPGQIQKVRAASTTGVVGEAKKQARSSLPPPAAATAAPATNPAPAVAAAPTPASSSSTAAANGTAKGDGPSWSDESCKLRLVINRFSHLEETMCSPPKSIEGVSWKIMVMPKQHMVQKKQQKCMGFFLQCAPERAYSDQWSVHAVADMRMISYKPNVPHFARRTTHTYTSKENDWGYSCFMTWADIIDEAQGYIRDDTVVLEIAVKADAPKNMMSHEDFLDKIEKWIVLADMQMKKGNIDLALEANQSAMKFCKGKDDVCYQRLETQRETFVNAKLFESIERIEKGPVVCTDTTHGKPTSLRQALTGAQKSLNGKMTAKGGKKTRAVVTVQHMKKKPYDQNGTAQQRKNTGTTVKDMVEKRKSSKSDDGTVKKDLLKSKEELDAERDDQTESEESPDEKATASGEEEDDVEFDDEEYHEGDYVDQAEECSALERQFDGGAAHGMFQLGNPEEMDDEEEEEDDDDEDDNSSVEEDEDTLRAQELHKASQVMKAIQMYERGPDSTLFQGKNEEDVIVCDRMVQTDFEEMLKEVLEGEPPVLYEDAPFQRLLAETVLCKFSGPDQEQATVQPDTYFEKVGVQAIPLDPIEKIFGAESCDEIEDSFSPAILESLPPIIRSVDSEEDSNSSTLSTAERMIRTWLDVEGALVTSLDPDGVIAKLSDADRQKLLEELNFKINPLIVTLDVEFRETVHCARTFLMSTRNALDESQKVAAECDDMKKTFEEKLANNGFVPKATAKRTGEPVKVPPTTPATNGVIKSAVNGRPTVIAKRSIKPVVVDVEQSEDARGRASDLLRCVDTTQGQAFRKLNATMQPMIATIAGNNRKVQKLFAEMLGENGIIAKHIKDLVMAHNAKTQEMQKTIASNKDALQLANDEKAKFDKLSQENLKQLNAEVERHAKTQKEVKDLKNQLKKAESKATKEENRATTLQVQLNEIDEKAKSLRKELETLKKKSAEERTKSKKEKERDTQTIRQQSIEISERENERDKARKEIDEVNRGKDKVQKEKNAVATQLAAMTDRARTAEVAVLEARWNAASDELKKRKEAVQNGYTETETLANKVRQVSDRDIMRKSLAEWKAALDKCDAQLKSVKTEYDHAIEQVKSGSKTLVQTIDIKLPAADPLPKLVKPPPVQVVAPSAAASVIPPPIIPPTPAAGVIGQQRTLMTRQGPSSDTATACSSPARSRVARVPSPVTLKPASRADDAPTSLWSWNTIGNLGDLREPSRNDHPFSSPLDSLQRDIWAANGNGNGSLGGDFLRSSSASLGLGTAPGSAPSPFIRMNSQPVAPSNQQQQQQQQSSLNMSQNSYASQQSQMQNNQRMQQQQQQQQQQRGGYGDMWNGPSLQQQQQASNNQDYGAQRIMHNGAGDLSNGQAYTPWHNPPQSIGSQLRGGTPQQSNNHHNMFQQHSYFNDGM